MTTGEGLRVDAPERAAAVDMYKTDLERHLFAPTLLRGRRSPAQIFEDVGDWLRDWLLGGWSRWKLLAGAAN
jgi:hypothetical protein